MRENNVRELASKASTTKAMAIVLVALPLFVVTGCGGENTTNQKVETGGSNTTNQSKGGGANFEAEIGALDQDKVQSALSRASGKLTSCFQNGLGRVPFMGGEIKFALRIGQDGIAHVAYLKESSLGDRDTESCILGALKASSWPSPVGGKEGLAEGGFAFDPSPDERPPVTLDPDKLGKSLGEARSAINDCRQGAQAGPVKATVYIDTDGKPLSVGVATADAKGEGAASCVVDALRKMKFPSPGSYAGKVTLVAE